jgi:hypothetical protein
MKFISLGTKRSHSRGQLDKLSQAPLDRSINPNAVPHQIRTYAELRKQIHDDLRVQHPEWVQPNGESPMCDSYESRLTEMLDAWTRKGSDESTAASHRALEQELTRIEAAAV